MSLFLRIFLSFVLVATLLAASFFILGSYSSNKSIQFAKVRLKAQADVVANIWQQGGRTHTMHWLFQQSNASRPHLLNIDAINVFSMENMGMNPAEVGMLEHMPKVSITLQHPLKVGIQVQASGEMSLIEPLPNVEPPLFLVQQIKPSELRQLPLSLWFVIAFVIINIISYLLARTLSKRIHTLRLATQQLAEGDLNSRVNLSGKDEVNALANDFNKMAEQLQSMLKSQRQLVSDVSHELRSPLARLRIALELVEKSENPQNALSRIEKETTELESLVTNLLSLARIESAQSVLEKTDFSLCDLLQKIISDANYEGEKDKKQVLLRHCDNTIIHADPVLMQSAFENIIRNALRYTPQNSDVITKVKQFEGFLEITVDDKGEGVPEQSLKTLFEPFVRISEARDRSTGGFGLGLAITGKVIEAHAGTVSASNKKSGGLQIKITLPTT